MAYEKQNFRNADRVVPFRMAVMIAVADMFTADALYLRDLTKLICTNVTGAPVTLTIYETDGAGANPTKIHVISIPASSGNAAGAFAIKLLNDPTYQIPGVRYDAFGNFFLRVAPGKKWRAEASVDNALFLMGETESYQA